jgi:hypothetical protein
VSYETPPIDPQFDTPLHRGFIEVAERLEEEGFTADQAADAALAIGVELSCGLHGPGPVAGRLMALARLLAANAEQRGDAAPDLSVN